MDGDTATLERSARAPALQDASQAAVRSARQPARGGEYLSFRVGSEEYALDILKVQEIRSYEQPTRLAGASACVRGVVNLRGVIVPVVDLRVLLGVDATRFDDFTVVIVLNVLRRVIGVVVDSVSDVVELAPDQIHPAPELRGGPDAGFILGMATLVPPGGDGHGRRERMLIVTDIEALLGSADTGLQTETAAH